MRILAIIYFRRLTTSLDPHTFAPFSRCSFPFFFTLLFFLLSSSSSFTIPSATLLNRLSQIKATTSPTMSSSPYRLFAASTILAALAAVGTVQGQYSATYTPSPSGLPKTTEQGQSGTNDCGTANSQTSMCQNIYINSITDFCLFAPPNGGEVATFEAVEVSYCTKAGRGTRLIPEGTITGAHFVQTRHYVQVTGNGDFTKIGISANDQGGELDPQCVTFLLLYEIF